MRTVIVHGQEFDAPPGVVLPQENGLIVDEFATLRVDDFAAKVLVLQEIEEVQTGGVLDEARILRLLPVQQVLEVVDERLVLEISALGND